MQITFCLYDRFSNYGLSNALEPLRAANDLSGQQLFQWRVVSASGGPICSSSGLQIGVDGPLSEACGDLLVTLPSYGFRAFATPHGRAGLRAASRRFGALGGFDTGAWLLADAGLLDGHRATLHWEELDAFAEAFPEVDVVRARHLWDRACLTCAGASAAFDPMLELVEERAGAALRLEVALLFAQPGLAAQQGPEAKGDSRVAALLDLMQANLEELLPLTDIAQQLNLSPRALDRLTKTRLGTSPAALYRRLRLLRARKLTTETELAITEIALRCGYADPSAMTRAFKAEFGHPPQSLRG